MRPPPLFSSLTTKELVPNTGVEMLPKVQGPSEKVAWKCLRQTRKNVRQPGSQGRPLASIPRSLANSCSRSWKMPEPAAGCCTEGRREKSRQARLAPGASSQRCGRGRRGRGTLPATTVLAPAVAPSERRSGAQASSLGVSFPLGGSESACSGYCSPARPSASRSSEKLIPLGKLLPRRLLENSAARCSDASVGNPGEGY